MDCIIHDVTPLDRKRMTFHFGTYQYGVTIEGEGIPLFAIHGFSESSSTWEYIHLEGYRKICVDLIGHGTSSKPNHIEPYQWEQILKDLHVIIYSLSDEPYVLLGYSMGARIALLYALAYGDNIGHLILESGSVGIEHEEERVARRESDAHLAQEIVSHDKEWFATTWANTPIFSTQKSLPLRVQRKIYERRLHNEAHALAFTLHGSGQGQMPYVAHRLGELKMPVAYISGRKDEKYTAIGKRYFSSAHYIIPHVGHNVHIENPCAFMDVLQKILGASYDSEH